MLPLRRVIKSTKRVPITPRDIKRCNSAFILVITRNLSAFNPDIFSIFLQVLKPLLLDVRRIALPPKGASVWLINISN